VEKIYFKFKGESKMLTTLVSLVSASLIFVAAPSLRKNRIILEEDKSVIGKGYPYEYFEGEI
jgi:hypothetical protein